MLHLQHLDLEGRDVPEFHARDRADAVYPYSQAHHVELELREAFYAGGVEHVPHRAVTKCIAQGPGIALEH